MKLGHADNPGQPVVTDPEASRGPRRIFIATALGIAAFFFYKWLLYYYVSGDPKYYQIYYDALFGHDIIWAITNQELYLGSSEIIYPAISWFGSNIGIERNVLMAAFDGLMYFALICMLTVNRANVFFILLFITNFYIVVISTSAERLKFAYILLFLAAAAPGKLKFIWLALSPLAHFQSLITGSAVLLWNARGEISVRLKIAAGVIALAGFGAIGYFFSSAIAGKFSSYQGRGGAVDAIPGIALLIISLFIFRFKSWVLVTMLPLVLLTVVLGSGRVNMILFTVFVYILLSEKKTDNVVVIAIMAYYSIKSVDYIHNIILYGNGFVFG